MKCKNPDKYLEDFEKKINKKVDEMIGVHTTPTFLFLSEQDKVFLKRIFMAGFIEGENRSTK